MDQLDAGDRVTDTTACERPHYPSPPHSIPAIKESAAIVVSAMRIWKYQRGSSPAL